MGVLIMAGETKIIMLTEYLEKNRRNRIRPKSKEAEIIEAKAYEWAVSTQKRYGIIATPIRLTGFDDGDKLTYNSSEVYVSVFYDKETETAILRRDWDDAVQYNVLVNYADLQKTAPHSMKKLIENGLRHYRYHNRAEH